MHCLVLNATLLLEFSLHSNVFVLKRDAYIIGWSDLRGYNQTSRSALMYLNHISKVYRWTFLIKKLLLLLHITKSENNYDCLHFPRLLMRGKCQQKCLLLRGNVDRCLLLRGQYWLKYEKYSLCVWSIYEISTRMWTMECPNFLVTGNVLSV